MTITIIHTIDARKVFTSILNTLTHIRTHNNNKLKQVHCWYSQLSVKKKKKIQSHEIQRAHCQQQLLQWYTRYRVYILIFCGQVICIKIIDLAVTVILYVARSTRFSSENVTVGIRHGCTVSTTPAVRVSAYRSANDNNNTNN